MADPGKNTFKRITNNDIFRELMETKEHVLKQNGSIKLNMKWLYGLSAIVLAIISWALAA